MQCNVPVRLSLIAAIAVTPALADEWSKRFTISGRADLRVNAGDGAVTVRAWDRNEIEARVTTVGWRIGPSDIQIIDRQAGDRVELELRIPRHGFNFNLGRRSIHVELQVPRELRSDIRTGDGPISVDGIKGDTRLTTGDGRIEGEALDGALDAHTGDGRVRVRGRFDALRLQTGDGHVTLRIPESLAADLEVHTGDGHITSDLAITTNGAWRDHDLRGKINGGGAPFIVRTNDGSVRLERL
jgi:DUF4097 and DUF4098 domain-containing protein YvlB